MDTYHPAIPSHLAEKGYAPLRYSVVGFEGFLNAKLLVEILKRMGMTSTSRIRDVVEI
jgi:hypothetical protein